MLNKSMFSNQKNDWLTPKWLFEKLDFEFNFIADVACTKENALCNIYIDETINALRKDIDWYKSNFCNPPYKTKIQNMYFQKAHEQALKDNTTVMLVPARTDTVRFHEIVLKNNYEVRFIRGRLKFSNSNFSAPFPSMIIIFQRCKNGR